MCRVRSSDYVVVFLHCFRVHSVQLNCFNLFYCNRTVKMLCTLVLLKTVFLMMNITS